MRKHTITNDEIVLTYIRRYGPVSKAAIARRTNITPPTVTNICTGLIHKGLISEDRQVRSALGRPSMLLKFNEDFENYLVVHVRTHCVEFYIVSSVATIVEKRRESTIGRNSDEILNIIYNGIDDIVRRGLFTVKAIGVILRGPVDSEKGISVYSPSAKWHNIPFKYILEERFHIPVYIENDVRCLAVGEYVYGKGKGVSSLLVLKFSYGLGATMVLNGQLYRGYSDGAGEIGHTVISVQGSTYKMLEEVASETAIRDYVKEAIDQGRRSSVADKKEVFDQEFSVDAIYEAAVRGDEVCLEALHRVGGNLGVALANVTNLMNPERIVLSSSMGNAVGIMDPILRDVVEHSSYKTHPVDLVYSSNGSQYSLLGMVDIICTSRAKETWLAT